MSRNNDQTELIALGNAAITLEIAVKMKKTSEKLLLEVISE